MAAASSLASSSSLQLPLWSVEALAGDSSFDDDRWQQHQQQQQQHRVRHTRLADTDADTDEGKRPPLP